MTFQVLIRQHGGPIAVEPGATILESALEQGVPYPHGCRSGNCGACKSSLERGEVEMAAYSEYALTPEERGQGLILACRAVPWSDVEVAWLGSDEVVAHPLRRLSGTVVEMHDLTHDIKRVRIELNDPAPFLFSAGQYAALRFAGLAPRDYSMANDPLEPVLEFHIRKVGGGPSSHYAAERLQVGETVGIEGPYGSSWLREQHKGPILALAGGSGLAPIKSIVETALRRGMAQPIYLYAGVRDENDLYLEAHFRALVERHANFRFVAVLSEPSAATERRTGFVHDAALHDLGDLDGFKAYVAGPPVMVESATPRLVAQGMRRQDIHADAFYTEAEKQALTAGASP
jgi:naphthalene 1,2-dioxygenase ferredoxin reductase component